mmetsp:Transcript_55116/g.131342  ORF Transcript_55116/g.131342 Transcript_55116/m.131342 type:complete len:286 (+) Transcript_55116:112-969(+)|eukprot:CAMPEP_0178431684 /NCGR_PEP_ID=MMETSP0689_2-20121128/31984_1 /TAXON_ID=160604 /ORGANISM="Amphidinium massartii, Strain CS-259" /LENGTH=285 /DNA_ID=CAMNT_0020053623 /DNA_START=260 /DNA_END=1117 /DNA_ORIENTATION=-
MSLREVREIFEQQVERAIVKLQQTKKAQERRTPGKGGLEEDDMVKLRDLAMRMTDSIIRKLVENRPLWNVDMENSPNPQEVSTLEASDLGLGQARPDHGAGDVPTEQTLARLRAVQEKLEKKRAEEVEHRGNLLEKLKQRYSTVLDPHDQDLLLISESELQRSAKFAAQRDDMAVDMDPREEEMVKEIGDARERLGARLEATKRLLCDLQESRKNLNAVEQQQSRGLPGVEQLLQSGVYGGPWDAEEMELLDAISKADIMCKRVGRDAGYFSDAAGVGSLLAEEE